MIIRATEKLMDITGKISGLCVLLMAALTGAVVLYRYALGSGSIALQESTVYLHACVFMLGAAVSLQRGAHVRVDVFYRNRSITQKAWIDLIGSIIFLVPFSIFIVAVCWHFVSASWAIGETSADAGGLALVWLLKTLIPICGSLLCLQSLVLIAKNLQLLLRAEPR